MNNRWSVRKLVQFTMRSGDIDNGFFSNRRALEGIRLHQKLQNKYPKAFESEVMLKGEVALAGTEIFLEGRVDGLNEEEHLLDEIKSTIYTKEEIDARPNSLHWAQLTCYGYLYAMERGLEAVTLRLTYIRIEDEEVFHYEKKVTREELTAFMEEVLTRLGKIQSRLEDFEEAMDESTRALAFPYDAFRPGQREMAVAVYNMIQTEGTILIEAPTGIGKTLATLFSSIKSIGEGLSRRVFYATGRSTQKTIAMDALDHLEKAGLRIKRTELVAKEKACLMEEVDCRPEVCPYAKGHYDRLLEGILDIFDSEDGFTGEAIRRYSEKHRLCPFEFGLDLSDFSSVILGDYNYVFHPKTYLERLMEERDRTGATVLLIDEAHNLIDRARDMYSARLRLDELSAAPLTDEAETARAALYEALSALSSKKGVQMAEVPERFSEAVEDLTEALARLFARTKEEPEESVLELYFSLLDWQNRLLYYNKRRFTFFVPEEGTLSLLCLDPSRVLAARRELFRAVVYFSATLTPASYHRECLGAGEGAEWLSLPSPFDPEHLLVLHPAGLSVRYRDREANLSAVSALLRVFTETRKGNYIHFFPSYRYKDQVLEANAPWEDEAHDQTRGMSEAARAAFLRRFFEERPVHGYAVMGGVFSEGVDLHGDALEGVSILTLSLPGLSPERELIKDRFNALGRDGYAYAYLYPGMTKVVQAAGRIIRTATDRGQLLLIDDRFSAPRIRALLPRAWRIQRIHNIDEMKDKIENFWRSK